MGSGPRRVRGILIKGVSTRSAHQVVHNLMWVIFETESGAIVTDEIFVRTGVPYEVRIEVVGPRNHAAGRPEASPPQPSSGRRNPRSRPADYLGR